MMENQVVPNELTRESRVPGPQQQKQTMSDNKHPKILAIRESNVYGAGDTHHHQTGFNQPYYEQMGTKSDYLCSSSANTVKSFAQVVQYGSMGEEFMSEEELLQPNEYVVNISCGVNHSLFVTNFRRVFCCGDNGSGNCAKVQSIATVSQVTLIPELTHCNIVETKCGNMHSLFISEGYECVYVSGYNIYGECGLASGFHNINSVKKLEKIEGKKLKCVAPSAFHTVFVTVDDCVYTSGYCAFGSLGQGHQSQPCPLPVKVNHPDLANGLKRIKTAVCGQWHTIVIIEDGSAYSWGYNIHGQCGLNSSSLSDVASPSLVTGIPPHEKLVDARCGSCFTVFRTESNTFYGCGSNDHGALGLPTVYRQSVVAHIPLSIGTVLDYSCGTNFTVFTTKEGGAYTCGYQGSGLDNIFQLQDDRQIGEITLPWVVSRTESRELHVACGQSGLHIMLYNVPKNTHPIFSNKLFAAQQKALLCDMTVVFEE